MKLAICELGPIALVEEITDNTISIYFAKGLCALPIWATLKANPSPVV
jgi:hypothetical protein